MQDYESVRRIVGDVTYKDWTFQVSNVRGLRLRAVFNDPVEGEQHGRWWTLSPWMTKSEVVTTALKAVLTAEEHEARENFRYKGVRIFGPHINVEALVQIARFKDNLDLRPEPLTDVQKQQLMAQAYSG